MSNNRCQKITIGQTTRNRKFLEQQQRPLAMLSCNPKESESWLAPGDMTAKIHAFDFEVGGGYEMSLFYSPPKKSCEKKPREKEDRFKARFIELIPNKKIVQAVNFESADPNFAGEMIMEVTIAPE